MFAKQPRKHQSSQLPPLRGPNQSKPTIEAEHLLISSE